MAVNVLASTWHCSLWVKLLPLQSRIFSKSHDIAELERGIFWLSPAVHSVKVLPLFQFQSEAWLDENNDMKIQRCRKSHLKTRGGIKEGHFEGSHLYDGKHFHVWQQSNLLFGSLPEKRTGRFTGSWRRSLPVSLAAFGFTKAAFAHRIHNTAGPTSTLSKEVAKMQLNPQKN